VFAFSDTVKKVPYMSYLPLIYFII